MMEIAKQEYRKQISILQVQKGGYIPKIWQQW